MVVNNMEEDEELTNKFANDGSFFEKFKQMQEQQKSAEKEAGNAGGGLVVKTERDEASCSAKRYKESEHGSVVGAKTIGKATKPRLKTRWGVVSSNPLVKQEPKDEGSNEATPIKRKRRSRWGAPLTTEEQQISEAINTFTQPTPAHQPQQYQQLLEQQELNKVANEVKKVARAGTVGSRAMFEDTQMEMWEKEHLKRALEMDKTADQAEQITEANKGKHFIGDFLPSDEFKKFIDKVNAIKEGKDPNLVDSSTEQKLSEDNIGYKMLLKAGWKGEGLGIKEDGITAPVSQGKQSFDQAGVGVAKAGEVAKQDDEFDVYRKRMMLAYKFRPNPLNNPRRPYY